MLVEAFDQQDFGRTKSNEGFNKFKSGDYNVRDEGRRVQPKRLKATNGTHSSMNMMAERRNNL